MTEKQKSGAANESLKGIPIDLRKIEVSEGMEVGEYANSVWITHTAWDFVLDFCKIVAYQSPTGPVGKNRLVRRILISPFLVKSLIQALQEQVETYERQFSTKLPSREELKQAP